MLWLSILSRRYIYTNKTENKAHCGIGSCSGAGGDGLGGFLFWFWALLWLLVGFVCLVLVFFRLIHLNNLLTVAGSTSGHSSHLCVSLVAVLGV